MEVGQSHVVQAQQIEDGGVHVPQRDLFLQGLDSELVGGSGGGAALDVSSGHPHHQGELVVVASGSLGLEVVEEGGAAHFRGPDHQRFIQQPPLLEVLKQARHRQVDLGGMVPHASLDVGVIVPAVLVDLHAVNQQRVAHPPLHHPPGQQTLAAEPLGDGIVQSVETTGLGRLSRQVHRFRGRGLHAVGQFVGADPGLQLGSAGSLIQVPGVEEMEQVELPPLLSAVHPARKVQVQDGGAAGTQHGSLVGRGQIAAPPDGGAVHRGPSGVLNHHVAGQVPVGAAQSIGDPGTYRSAALKLGPGGDVHGGGAVVVVLDLDPVDEGQVVGALADAGKEAGDGAARLAVALEFKGAGNDPVRLVEVALDLSGKAAQGGQFLPGEFLQSRLVVEAVHVADPSRHEHEDAVLGLAAGVRQGRSRGSRGACRQLVRQHAGQGQGSDPVAGTAEKVPPGQSLQRQLGDAVPVFLIHGPTPSSPISHSFYQSLRVPSSFFVPLRGFLFFLNVRRRHGLASQHTQTHCCSAAPGREPSVPRRMGSPPTVAAPLRSRRALGRGSGQFERLAGSGRRGRGHPRA